MMLEKQNLSTAKTLRHSIAAGLAIAMVLCTGCQSLRKQPTLSTAADTSFVRDLSIARLSERHDDVDKAKHIYHAILAQDANHQESLHRLGVIAARNGETTEALTYLESALNSGPPTAEILGDLGYIHYQQRNFERAEDDLNHSLDLDPRNKRSINNLGLALAAQKKYDRALALFSQVGTQAEAYANLAYAQTQHMDLDAAESNYHRALEADPTTKVAAIGLIELRKHSRMNRARGGMGDSSMIARRKANVRGSTRSPTQTLIPQDTVANYQATSPAIQRRNEANPSLENFVPAKKVPSQPIATIAAKEPTWEQPNESPAYTPMSSQSLASVSDGPSAMARRLVESIDETSVAQQPRPLRAVVNSAPNVLESDSTVATVSYDEELATVPTLQPLELPVNSKTEAMPAAKEVDWPEPVGLSLAPVEQPLTLHSGVSANY